MDVLTAIHSRRAVRHYMPQPVPDEIIQELLQAATQAPSAVNQQPWAFVVIQDRELLDRLSEEATRLLSGRPEALEYIERARRNHGSAMDIFHGAHTLVVFCSDSQGLHPEYDVCLAAENFMLAAREMGLGTCVIGFAWPVLDLPDTRKELGIPDRFNAVLPIIVGYPRDFPVGPPRKPPRILSWKRSKVLAGH